MDLLASWDIHRRLYDWVIQWAGTPYGTVALFLLAFAESSFFPIPPDILLIALAIGRPEWSLWFALVCSVGSVLGGILGYGIGHGAWEATSGFFFKYIVSEKKFDKVKHLYERSAFWAVFTAGLTPIPYKIFTIAGGVCRIRFSVFMIASILSRSARFFAVATLIWYFGPAVKNAIDRYFNVVCIVFTLLLVGGFLLVRFRVKAAPHPKDPD